MGDDVQDESNLKDAIHQCSVRLNIVMSVSLKGETMFPA